MRKILLLIPILVTITSCSKTEVRHTECDGLRTLTLSIGSASVKTAIDGSLDGTVIPVWWSEGDIINVNGQKSAGFSGDGRVSSAEFKISNVHPPYKMVYPHSVYAGESSDGTVLINIPAVQAYTENSFESGSMIMYGYSESGNIDCRYACGAIKIGLRGEPGQKIKSMAITSLSQDGNITGEFEIDPAKETITAGEKGGRTIEIAMPGQGLEMSGSDTYVIVTIPAGFYPEGFEIKIQDTELKVMRRFWLRHSPDNEPGITVVPGRMTDFREQTLETDSREINSADDWEAFVLACNADAEDWRSLWVNRNNSIVIGSDFAAESLTRLDNLPEGLTIAGNDHTITQTAAEGPLFGTIKGCVTNLNLAGVVNSTDPYSAGAAAFCSILDGGEITGCTNDAIIRIDPQHKDKPVRAAAFAGRMSGGKIAGCSNNGRIEIVTGLTASKEVLAGGIAGIVQNLSTDAYITDCVNLSDISISIEKSASGKSEPNRAGYGGIVGVVYDGNGGKYLHLERCTNKGNVSVSFAEDPASAANFSLSGVGGIIGINTTLNSVGDFPTTPSGYYLEMTECTNYGDIYNGLASMASSTLLDDVCAGGLAGILFGIPDHRAKVTDSANYGTVKTYEGTAFKRATYVNVCGGLCGLGGWLDFTGCSVISKQIGTVKGRTYSVSAGIGLAIKPFNMQRCSIYADVYAIRCTDFTEYSHSLAFCATKTSKSGNIDPKYGLDLSDSRISDCRFGGKITTNGTLANANNTSAVTTGTTILTEGTYSAYLISKTSGETAVVLENNTYWEGE